MFFSFSLIFNFQEPALLEVEDEVMSSVQKNSLKYYKYDLQNTTGIKTVFLKTSAGRGDISVSMRDKNPRNYHLNLGFCASHKWNKLTNSGVMFDLQEIESSNFCNGTEHGGCTEPRFVTKEEFLEEGIVIYLRKCSNRWFYISIEGINDTNTFNLTLFKDFIRTTEKVG